MLEAWLLTFARLAPVVALHPVLGGRALPHVALIGVAVAFTCALAPLQLEGTVPASAGGWGFALLFANEVVVGSTLGLVGKATFAAIETAGRLVDDARGAGAAQIYAPQTETFPSALGALELQLSLAVFWALDAHALLIANLAASFDALPVGRSPSLDGPALEVVCGIAGELMRAGAALAAPAMATCVLADLLFGLVNRAASQAPVFFLGLPVKLLAAVFVMALSLPDRVEVWARLWVREGAWLRALAGLSENAGP
jgi:flagellar biosynthetic protein FliR